MASAGLQIEKVHTIENANRRTQEGDQISMHYRGTLENGNQFDASYDRGQPLDFKLGAGQVIQGWDKGLLDMAVGEKRKLTIPPEMGYGARGFPPVIPANSVLSKRWTFTIACSLLTLAEVFETELVSIQGVAKEEL
ncbi:MAG: hypothetical protein Q9162_001967 [Coniocarpon cinnabarinum]